MARCKLCNDQEKKGEEYVRLAFDFTPTEISISAENGCVSCAVILKGLSAAESGTWSFKDDIRRVYARCRSSSTKIPDSLTVEIYFADERPKLELEFFSLDGSGTYKVESLHVGICLRSNSLEGDHATAFYKRPPLITQSYFLGGVASQSMH
jgi:hypothetical protein